MGGGKSFIWRDEYPSSFCYPDTDNLPISRYQEIFEGYQEHLSDHFEHIEQKGVPNDLLEKLKSDNVQEVYDVYEGDSEVLRTTFSAISHKWFNKIINEDVPEYKIPGEVSDHLHAHMLAAEGTRKATELAIENRNHVFHNGGGHHHAHRGGSSDIAFNMINDQAAGIEYAKEVMEEPEVLVADLDLHFGDGTVSIYAHDPDVYHLSMHEWNNFPRVNSGWLDYTGSGKAEGTKVNMPLPENVGGKKYLSVLEEIFPSMVEELNPDLVIYQAGVDPHKDDALGNLNLTNRDLYERDRIIKENTGDIPTITVTGGGYSEGAGKASTNTLAAITGEDIIFEGEELSQKELVDSKEAEEKTEQRLEQLLDQEELEFLL